MMLQTRSLTGFRQAALVVAVIIGMSACSGSSSSSTTTSPSATQSTQTFTGSIGQNGTALHPFTVASGGYSLLAGYTSLAPAPVTSLGLGIGTWDSSSSTCGLNLSQSDAAKSGSTALSGTAGSGNYCLRVYDGGNISEGVTASYTVQVQHY